MTVAKLPIVNYVNGAPMGDFCAEIEIGDGNTAFVILDTGSSTLAVWESAFGTAKTDATDCVQFVSYGTGHWAGPVKEAAISLGGVEVQDGIIAQIQSGIYRGRKQFYPADGILGLAYFTLNTAADVGQKDYPLSQYDSAQEWSALLQDPNVKETRLPPFFTQIEKQGLTPDKFAFATRRSFPQNSDNPGQDPANQGWFILGGGEDQTDLYTGEFLDVKEIDGPNGVGRYYNCNLTSVRVGQGAEAAIAPAQDGRFLSNAIIDSGTNALALSDDVMKALEDGGFPFATLRNPPSDPSGLPSIFFTFEGSDGDVTLECKPETYLQFNCLQAKGGTIPALSQSGMGQSILGLPLMNNYYVVFDRSDAKGKAAGKIRFATPNLSGYPGGA